MKSMDIKENKKKIFSIIFIIACVSIGTLVVFVFYSQQTPDYTSLFGEDYQSLLDDIGEPVENPVVPTIEHVNYWLHVDKTDDLLYMEDVWMCGDYAARLVVNAKERNWRMYVVILYYSIEGETGYGASIPNGNNGHAFNLIYCQDGDDADDELDVWYIEPQSDGVWQLNYDHYDVYSYYYGSSGTVWEDIYWVNYYDYLG